MSRQAFQDAERRLFERFGVTYESRSVRLEDPPVSIGVRESGTGPPVVFIHGSGMSGATWAPVIANLPDVRSIAVDLPGFGLSDRYSYSDRPLRVNAVAQMRSVLDALCLALEGPARVSAVVAIGMPAVALPGLHSDPFFTLLTIPGLGRVASRV